MAQGEENDVRVADYLDDKLQTLADLESLDALLLNVRNQQTLLRKQLEDAEIDFSEARKAANDHTAVLAKQKSQFDRQQAEIDKRLKTITRSDISDDAVRKFEASMERLRRLDVANGYVQMLQEVEDTSRLCESQLGKDDGAALEAYTRLHGLSASLTGLQDAADGAAPHLLDHIKQRTVQLRTTIENTFGKELEAVLKKINWPSQEATVSDVLYDELGSAMSKLLDLQMPELEEQEKLPEHIRARQPPVVLLPLKIMVHPLELGFRYHFEGDKPTNKLDHPEYFLSHVADRLLGQYSDFVVDNVQPILSQHFKGTILAMNPAYVDATSAFITALLPMVRVKVFSILPQVYQQPSLLSHLIHELMTFDTKLRDDWQYTAISTMQVWRGIAWDVLSTDEWFAKWLQVEKDFALARYEEIVSNPDSFTLDLESVGPTRTKPTKAAIRVLDLIETATDHYRPLTSFSQKLRFLIDIQTALFDRFHERLADNLRMYVARSSTLTRASKEEQIALQGLPGLETLCRTYGSASYLEESMRDWSDDVFFLELWAELQFRASSSHQETVGGTMTLAQVAQKTSSSIGSLDAEATGSIFDEPAAAYARLRGRCEELILELVSNAARQALAPYARINPWASLSNPTGTVAPSAELDPLLATLTTLLSFLAKALAPLPLRRITRSVCGMMDTYLFDRVVLARSFSLAGARQLEADLGALRGVLDKVVGGGVAESGLGRVGEAVKLLCVPVRGDKNGDGDSDEDGEGGERKFGLWEAERRLIKSDGESARAFLGELGAERLGVGEARRVLSRRVELGS